MFTLLDTEPSALIAVIKAVPYLTPFFGFTAIWVLLDQTFVKFPESSQLVALN
jgi:hypothetical protein